MTGGQIAALIFALLLLLPGGCFVFLGFAMIVLGSFTGSNASVEGFVLIGPVPIVFGSGKDAGLIAILSVAQACGL